jgi:hypothetical protein
MGHPGFEPGTNRLKARVQDDPYMASRLIQGENTTLIQVFSLMLVFVIPDVSCLQHRAIAHLVVAFKLVSVHPSSVRLLIHLLYSQSLAGVVKNVINRF